MCVPAAGASKDARPVLTQPGQPAGRETSATVRPASVTVAVGDQVVTSSITLEGLRELGLTEGSPVTVLVKASDVMLAVED